MTIDARLDPTDVRILEVLQRDGRRPYAEIGADVGMSGPSAHERVKKLEARGIITGYGARLDPASIGLGVVAYMWVTQSPGSYGSDLSDDFSVIEEIEACHRMAGEADYLLKVRAASPRDLEQVVREVQVMEHVFRTETDVAFSTAFEGRPLPVDRVLAGPSAAGAGSRADAGEPLPQRTRRHPPTPGAEPPSAGAEPPRTAPAAGS